MKVGWRRGEGDDGRGEWDDGCRVVPFHSLIMDGGGFGLSVIDADAATGGWSTTGGLRMPLRRQGLFQEWMEGVGGGGWGWGHFLVARAPLRRTWNW